LNGATPSRDDPVVVIAAEQNQQRLQRMIRQTEKVVRASTNLLQQTNELVERSQALCYVVTRAENGADEKLRQELKGLAKALKFVS
jgi:hypothetical protein